MILGRILRVWREDEKITLTELADKIGVSKATLSRFETGKTLDGRNELKILWWVTRERMEDDLPIGKKKEDQ